MKKKPAALIDEDGEVRPLRRNDTVRFSRLRDHFPELAEFAEKRKRGRPKVEAPKKVKSFKLSQDVIEAIMASGKGYNTRVEAVLRAALAEGRL